MRVPDGLRLGPAEDRNSRMRALMRRHRAAMSLIGSAPTEDDRLRLLSLVVAPTYAFRRLVEEIDDDIADGAETVNFNFRA